jgi:hypothetical protein
MRSAGEAITLLSVSGTAVILDFLSKEPTLKVWQSLGIRDFNRLRWRELSML